MYIKKTATPPTIQLLWNPFVLCGTRSLPLVFFPPSRCRDEFQNKMHTHTYIYCPHAAFLPADSGLSTYGLQFCASNTMDIGSLSHIFQNRNDLHRVLGLQKGCSESDIKRSYRRLALRYHPDKYEKGVTLHSEAEHLEAFRVICRAQEILLDDKKRKIYELGGMDDVDKFESRGGVGMPSFAEAIQMVSLVCLVFSTREGFRNVRRANNPNPDMDVPFGDAETRRRCRTTRRQEMQCSYTRISRTFRILRWALLLAVMAVLLVCLRAHIYLSCSEGDGVAGCVFSTLRRTLRSDDTATNRGRSLASLKRRGGAHLRSLGAEQSVMYRMDAARWAVATSPSFDTERITRTSSLFQNYFESEDASISLLSSSQDGYIHGPYLSSGGVPFYSRNAIGNGTAQNVSISTERIAAVGESYCDFESILRQGVVARASRDQFGRRWEPPQRICSDVDCRTTKMRPLRLRRIPASVDSVASVLPPVSPFCSWWQDKNQK